MLGRFFRESVVDPYGKQLDGRWTGSTEQLRKAWEEAFDFHRAKFQDNKLSPEQRQALYSEMRRFTAGMRIFAETGVEFIKVERSAQKDRRSPPEERLRELQQKMRDSMSEQYMDKDLHVRAMRTGLETIMNDVCRGDCFRQHAADTVRQTPTPPALNWAGDGFRRRGEHESAKQMYDQALAMDPRNVEALAGRAAAQFEMKNFRNAADDARAALRLDPGNQQAQAILALAGGRGGGSGAAASAPAPDATHSHAAHSANGGGSYAARNALAAARPSPEAQQAAGMLRQAMDAARMRDFDAAARLAGRAIELDPSQVQAYLARAAANLRLRNYDGALKDAVAGLQRDPKNVNLLLQKAEALNKLRRYSDALNAANHALELNPSSAYAYRWRAEALAGLGRGDEARLALQRAAKLDGRFAELAQAALQLPADADIMYLFAEDAGPRGGAAGGAERTRKFGVIAVAALFGGGLLAFGLLRLFMAPIQSAFTRWTRRGPAVAAAPPVDEADTGLLRGQYRTLRQIAVGGMGLVYEGTDISLERPVAIKKMRDEIKLDQSLRRRFINEAKLVAALHHPNIVDIYAIVEQAGDVFLVFEFVSGQTVHQLISSKGRLPLNEAVTILRGVATALEHAHHQNVIHRDLKPSNIMVTAEGQVKVMDFGIARVAKEAMTRYSMTNTVVGTPPYMAPEQEQGVVRKESDVYALGVCLYEMLSGRLPFAGTSGGMLMNKLNKSYAPLSTVAEGLPEAIDAVVDAALEPDPDKRVKSARQWVAQLEALAAARPIC